MHGAQVDGKVVRAKFTFPERTNVASPPKAVATTSRRDPLKAEDVTADCDRDGGKRHIEVSPHRKQLSPPRRRSPGPCRGSPRRDQDSPPPPCRRPDSPPYRQGNSPPIRKRPPSPGRGRSPSPPPRRYRSPPRSSPRRVRGSPVRWRSRPPLVLQEGLQMAADAVALPLLGGQLDHHPGHPLLEGKNKYVISF